jgi:DNA modification methylase
MNGVLVNGDCRLVLKDIPSNVIDLVVTDAPYGCSFMGKDWDTFNEVVEPKGGFQADKGFAKLPRNKPNGMYDFFSPIWKETLRVMKPGAFAFVMCSPRQDVHCQQVRALTDAGFEVSFSPIYWTYSSGFPKAHNIARILDKRTRGVNVERFAVLTKEKPPVGMVDGSGYKVIGFTKGVHVPLEERKNGTGGISIGAVNVKQIPAWIPQYETDNPRFQGAYGGFQPKPAVEVIVVAMKPMTEPTFADQALRNGKGVTWLDDCRIPCAASTQGRFPANLLVSDDVLNDGRKLQSAVTIQNQFVSNGATGFQPNPTAIPGVNQHGDVGSYSRYFDLDKWAESNGIKEENNTFPFLICSKPSNKERGKENRHPTVKPLRLMSYLIALGSREGDIILDPFAGSGTTLLAAKKLGRRYVGCELSPEYCQIIEGRLKAVQL